MPRETPPLPEDGIYRSILLVLVVSMVIGVAATLAGEYVWRWPELRTFGAWTALVCGGLYFLFRVLGHREARRRARRDAPADRDDPGA